MDQKHINEISKLCMITNTD